MIARNGDRFRSQWPLSQHAILAMPLYHLQNLTLSISEIRKKEISICSYQHKKRLYLFNLFFFQCFLFFEQIWAFQIVYSALNMINRNWIIFVFFFSFVCNLGYSIRMKTKSICTVGKILIPKIWHWTFSSKFRNQCYDHLKTHRVKRRTEYLKLKAFKNIKLPAPLSE